MPETKKYPALEEEVLKRMGNLAKDAPDVMKNFMGLHGAAVAPAALSQLEKELIATGIAIAVHCEGCIACHVHDALKAGATPEQIYETVGVAVLMGGGPAVVYGSMAHQAVKEFLQEK